MFLPARLQAVAGGCRSVDVAGTTVGAVLLALDARFPGIADYLVEDGRLRPGIAVAIGSELTTLGLHEPVAPEAEVHIVPALGGG